MYHYLYKLQFKQKKRDIMSVFKKGFTLAEVLITLLIIGVIASIVIPGLIADTQQAEYKAAWKKAFASISQAHKQIIMDNGGTLADAAANNSDLRNLFKNKMNTVTTCDDASCTAISLLLLNGTTASNFASYSMVLSDGTIIGFNFNSSACTHNGWVYNTGECAWLIVDVNGKKKPNQWGKDIYGIWVINNQILPWGANPAGTASSSYVESTCSTSGYGCGSKYLYN